MSDHGKTDVQTKNQEVNIDDDDDDDEEANMEITQIETRIVYGKVIRSYTQVRR